MVNVYNLGGSHQEGMWSMIAGAGITVKFVLFILLVFSILSWAIIVYKYRVIRKMEKESVPFLELFWNKKQFTPIFEASANYRFTPLARLFVSGYNELLQMMGQRKEGAGGTQFSVSEIDGIQRALKKAASVEISKMEKAVSFLATTGNTTPFIGLFGTVWGIMNSFRGIGLKGSPAKFSISTAILLILVTKWL